MDNTNFQKLQEAIVNGNIPQMVMSVISYALDRRSSDIHIEPEEKVVRLRYRIDGVLHAIIEYPPNIHPAVVSRIKIMSNLKIDEQRIPQDGRIQITTEDRRPMDLRVSTLPTVNGEKICMRVQDKSRKIPQLSDLGMRGTNLERIQKAIEAPNGIILTSGPTGSGKTTTLYSCLQSLNKDDVNIMTIEDPCEIQIDGLNQSQVHPDIGYSFAYGLRTGLRQDPDIIMVGEIRDKETVDVAIEAALTGHLVLSTIHTNSALDTIVRIGNMGVPQYLVTAAVNVIIAQRLARRICTQCCEEREAPEELADIKAMLDDLHEDEKAALDPQLMQKSTLCFPKGCEVCGNTGYFGRVGIYEVLVMTEGVKKALIDGASIFELEKIAKQEGMITLKQAGAIKALEGVTTLEEIYHLTKF